MKYAVAIALGILVTALIVVVSAMRLTFTAVWNYPYTVEEAKQCIVASRGGEDFLVFRRHRWFYVEAGCESVESFLTRGSRVPSLEEWRAAVRDSIDAQADPRARRHVPDWMIPAPGSDLAAFAASNQCPIPNCAQWFGLVAYGFPFRCAWAAEIASDCPGNRTCQQVFYGAWAWHKNVLGKAPRWFLHLMAPDSPGIVIPRRLMVMGLIGNIAVWSGVMFGCVTIAHRTAIAVRARVRRARGLCEGCGYPTPATADVVRCPECGRVCEPKPQP